MNVGKREDMSRDFDYEQMIIGELYLGANLNYDNKGVEAKKLEQKINNWPIEDREGIMKLQRQLFGKLGEEFHIHTPMYVAFGKHIEAGKNFFANMDCIFLDVGKITFGDNVMVGPRVGFYTAGHPTDPDIRNSRLEFGYPITVGNNVWIGGGSTIIPGITIGDNSIIAGGSVVTKDVPANCIVGGNPARFIRKVDEKIKQNGTNKLRHTMKIKKSLKMKYNKSSLKNV